MKAIWLFFVLVSLCSCGSSEKTATVDTHTCRWEVSEDSLRYVQVGGLTEDEIVRRFGTIRLRWAEYDTEKPPMPSTGKPPVRKEGEAKIALESERLQHTEHTDSTRMESTHRSASEEEEECHTTEEKKRENTGHIGAAVLVWLLLAVAICVVKRKLAE